MHKLGFFQIKLNRKVHFRYRHSTPQPLIHIHSIVWCWRQSELKCAGTGTMSEPLYQIFYFTDPILQGHITCSNLSFQYCALLHWPSCSKTFLRGIYIDSSSLANKDIIAGKPGSLQPLWSLQPVLPLSSICWISPTCCRKHLLEKNFGSYSYHKGKRKQVAWHVLRGFVSAQLRYLCDIV